MMRVLGIPSFGDGSGEGAATVVAIPLTVGHNVQIGDTLLEVETDKATLEIPAEAEGMLDAIMVSVGDRVQPGTEFARLLVDENSAIKSCIEAKVDNKLPRATVAAVAYRDDQVTVDSSLPIPPQTAQFNINRGGTPTARSEAEKSCVRANPGARRLAREIGIDPAAVRGSGARGRITKRDIKQHANGLNQSSAKAGKNGYPVSRAMPDFSEFGALRREPLTNVAATIRDNMTNAWSRIPHAWLQETVDITGLEVWRQLHKHKIESQGGAFTITAILAKAVAVALKSFPIINSSYDEESNEIIFKEYVDIGIAVDTDRGLVVPTLRQVDVKGMTEIAKDLKLLTENARNSKLSARDMQGAGITVSNLGGVGLSAIFPIVSWPQVAIIGVAASEIKPRFINDKFIPRRILTVTLGFDHRIVNGVEGARFLVCVKDLLEDSRLMLL